MKKTIFFTVLFFFFMTVFSFAGDAKKVSWKDFIDMTQFVKVLTSFIAALLTILTTALVSFINRKAEEAKKRTENIALKNLFGFLNNLIVELIEAESNKIKKLVDKILADGKVDDKEIDEAVKELRDEALRIASEHGLEGLDKYIGDSKEWLFKKIKAFLLSKLSENLLESKSTEVK